MAVKPEIVASRIKAGINGNHHIHDASHLGIDIKTTGFMFWKKTEIHITGRVDTDKEKAEVDGILDAEANGYPIVNKLRVDRR